MDKLAQTTAALSSPALLTSFTHDNSADFILPEYMAPIRRVVSVEVTVLPESRFLNGPALEFGGTLAFSVLYVGEDGTLSCASVTTEYTASCALGDTQIADTSRIGADTSAENVTCRVTGPRAITLRTKMRTALLLLEQKTVEETILDSAGIRAAAADEQALERRTAAAHDVQLSRGECTCTAAASLHLPPETKTIRASGAVRIEEARASAGEVQARGEVLLHVLTLSPEGRFVTVESRVPFAETVPVPDAAQGDEARASGRAASVTLRPGDAETAWEIEYDLEAETARPSEQTYTVDAYSVACASEVETEAADSLCLLRCGVNALTVTGESGRQSKPAPGESVIDTRASASADHMEVRDGKLILHGIAAVSVLLTGEGDVVCEEFTLPFRCEMNSRGGDAADLLSRCSVEVVSASARPEGDKLAVTLDLCISALAMSRATIRPVRKITLNRAEVHARRDGVVRICYPDPGESMWEIAKRYAVRRNTLGEAEASDGTPMIV